MRKQYRNAALRALFFTDFREELRDARQVLVHRFAIRLEPLADSADNCFDLDRSHFLLSGAVKSHFERKRRCCRD